MRTTVAFVAALGLAACQKSNAADNAAPAPSPKPVVDPMAKPAPAPEPTPKLEPIVPAKLPDDFAAIWNTPVNTLDGKPTTLAAFKGKEILVVNVASKCGNTPQYAQLEDLQKQYEGKGFTVVGFPCNQFGGQEPGTAEEIHTFCSTTYGVTFPMMEKIEVNGTGRHPIYKELTQIADFDGAAPGDIRWNFEKFVISADGKSVTRFKPKTKPDDPTVVAAIEAGLPKS